MHRLSNLSLVRVWHLLMTQQNSTLSNLYSTNCSGVPSVVWNPYLILVHLVNQLIGGETSHVKCTIWDVFLQNLLYRKSYLFFICVVVFAQWRSRCFHTFKLEKFVDTIACEHESIFIYRMYINFALYFPIPNFSVLLQRNQDVCYVIKRHVDVVKRYKI